MHLERAVCAIGEVVSIAVPREIKRVSGTDSYPL